MTLNRRGLIYAAAGTTAAAGALHLFLSSSVAAFNANMAAFFLVSGIAQLFWILPLVRRWNKYWMHAGIAGTGVLVALWAITRLDNPITGQAFPVNTMGIATQVLQLAFIGLLAAMVFAQRKKVPESRTH
jgi:hypothetical protein